MMKCQRIFKCLASFAVDEILDAANALFAPVRLGIVQHVHAAAGHSANSGSSEPMNLLHDLFSVEPLAQRSASNFATHSRKKRSRKTTGGTRAATESVVSGGDSESDSSDLDEAEKGSRSGGGGGGGGGDQVTAAPTTTNQRNSVTFREPIYHFYVGSDEEEDEDDDEEMAVAAAATAVADYTEEDDSFTDSSGYVDIRTEMLGGTTPSTERRTTTTTVPSTAPLQWAIPGYFTRPNSTSTTTTSTTTTTTAAAAAAAAAAARRSSAVLTSSSDDYKTMSSSSCLARVYGLLLREASDLIASVQFSATVDPESSAKGECATHAHATAVWKTRSVWDWLTTILDSSEAQLRYGASLVNATDSTTATTTGGAWNLSGDLMSFDGGGGGGGVSSQRRFMEYVLTLMRAQNFESGDVLPTIDVTTMQHVAYVLDAFVYFLRHDPLFEIDVDDETKGNNLYRKHPFFRRSKSTTHLGCAAPDPLAPLVVGLPLADRPHLLSSQARRELLFGSCSDSSSSSSDNDVNLPNCFGLNRRSCVSSSSSPALSLVTVATRWRLCVELFGRLFLDTVGQEDDSMLADLGGFELKEARFRRDMERHRNGATRDLSVEVDRERTSLIRQAFQLFNLHCERRQSGGGSASSTPLLVHRVKVTFKGEPGEGSGVTRSFYTSLSEASSKVII